MEFKLLPLEKEDLPVFKKDMQYAFQKGAVDVIGNIDKAVLSEIDIDKSLSKSGAAAYKAVVDGKISLRIKSH